MIFGLNLPNYSSLGNRKSMIAIAERAEELGYSSLWTSDHVLIPTNLPEPFGNLLETFTTLSYLAARTETIRLATGILVLPQRDPLLVAKQAATLHHLTLVIIHMVIAALIGVPLGILMVHRPTLRAIALGIASIFQSIPSLALFGFLIPLPFIGGIGKRTAIVALVLYALLPILRNTYVGLTGIDPAVLEAAEAMGMTRAQILFRVRFPLALAVILAGIRTATIITIGVATIAAAIGAGGLGTFIFRGVALVSDTLILAGAIPAALLALLADFLLGLVERKLEVS